MPSARLKELEKERLSTQKEYPQVSPEAGYRPSKLGESFIPLLHGLCDWSGTSLS